MPDEVGGAWYLYTQTVGYQARSLLLDNRCENPNLGLVSNQVDKATANLGLDQ